MTLYISKFSFYKAPHDNPGELPKLSYVDPLFRRRLSQITRMTIEVLHSLIGENEDDRNLKLVFSSFRGEIARQLKINKGLVEDGDVMPAPFSLSVFNTPAAAATIALGMKAGYTAIYPSQDNFSSALIGAAAGLVSGLEKRVIFAYSDEKIPDEYKDCLGFREDFPFAFACIISSEKSEGAIELDLENKNILNLNAQHFLEYLQSASKEF